MSANLICYCTCLLCHTYGHDAVKGVWWFWHGKTCPESGTGEKT